MESLMACLVERQHHELRRDWRGSLESIRVALRLGGRLPAFGSRGFSSRS